MKETLKQFNKFWDCIKERGKKYYEETFNKFSEAQKRIWQLVFLKENIDFEFKKLDEAVMNGVIAKRKLNNQDKFISGLSILKLELYYECFIEMAFRLLKILSQPKLKKYFSGIKNETGYKDIMIIRNYLIIHPESKDGVERLSFMASGTDNLWIKPIDAIQIKIGYEDKGFAKNYSELKKILLKYFTKALS